MSSRGSITLGELQGKLTMLEIACHRCDRRGRLILERLIDEHGADTGLPDLCFRLSRQRYHEPYRCSTRPTQQASRDNQADEGGSCCVKQILVYRWRGHSTIMSCMNYHPRFV